jgi:hypothetical protein
MTRINEKAQAPASIEVLTELSELELALIGGGIGNTIPV